MTKKAYAMSDEYVKLILGEGVAEAARVAGRTGKLTIILEELVHSQII